MHIYSQTKSAAVNVYTTRLLTLLYSSNTLIVQQSIESQATCWVHSKITAY